MPGPSFGDHSFLSGTEEPCVECGLPFDDDGECEVCHLCAACCDCNNDIEINEEEELISDRKVDEDDADAEDDD